MATKKPFEFFIQWHLTERCNLRCRHCYQVAGNIREMPLPAIRKIVAEASDMIKNWSDLYGIAFTPSMNVTGGEPLLRRDLFDVLRTMRQFGFEVSLLTNGTLVDRACAEKLADLGVNGVQVSMEGPEDVHDAIRGRGSFSASAAGVKQLVDCGIPVTLNVTVSSLNVRYAGKVIAFGARSGVRRVGFSRLVPMGRGRALQSRMLTQKEIRGLYETLFSLDFKGLDIVTGDPVAAQMKIKIERDAGATAIGGCAAGVSGLTIQPNGDVTPCRRLPLTLGNALKDPLRKIWAASPVLEALRDRRRYRGRCGACPRWSLCRGCRAIAYACSRSKGGEDFLGDDPQCFFTTADAARG